MRTVQYALLGLVFSQVVWSNGGPVAWTSITPFGGIRLKQAKNIALIKEDLDIRLNENLNDYSVVALYEIHNQSKSREQLFGIPLTWSQEEDFNLELDPEDDAKQKEDKQTRLSQFGKQISIQVNGKAYSCNPIKLSEFPTSNHPSIKTKRWCVAKIELQKGSNTIRLSYLASLDYLDMSYSKSALTEFSHRKLIYELYPAGYWETKGTEVNIRVKLGRYNGHLLGVSPIGHKVKDDYLIWNLKDADLKKMGTLEIIFSKGILAMDEIATWNKSGADYQVVKMKAKASSTLKSTGKYTYNPSNVLDGNPNTAWCEGKKGNGKSESIKLYPADDDIFDIGQGYCRIQAIGVLPGYTKSQKTYTQNNRVKKIKISKCGGSPSYEYNLPISAKHDLSSVLIDNEKDRNAFDEFMREYRKKHGNDYTHPDYKKVPKPKLDFIIGSKCIEFEILEVEKGKSSDTCISEISIIQNCG